MDEMAPKEGRPADDWVSPDEVKGKSAADSATKPSLTSACARQAPSPAMLHRIDFPRTNRQIQANGQVASKRDRGGVSPPAGDVAPLRDRRAEQPQADRHHDRRQPEKHHVAKLELVQPRGNHKDAEDNPVGSDQQPRTFGPGRPRARGWRFSRPARGRCPSGSAPARVTLPKRDYPTRVPDERACAAT